MGVVPPAPKNVGGKRRRSPLTVLLFGIHVLRNGVVRLIYRKDERPDEEHGLVMDRLKICDKVHVDRDGVAICESKRREHLSTKIRQWLATFLFFQQGGGVPIRR